LKITDYPAINYYAVNAVYRHSEPLQEGRQTGATRREKRHNAVVRGVVRPCLPYRLPISKIPVVIRLSLW